MKRRSARLQQAVPDKKALCIHEARCHYLVTNRKPAAAVGQELEKQKERLCFDCYATAFRCGGWDYLRKILALDPERPEEVRDSDGRSLLMIATTSEQLNYLLTTCKVSPYVVSPVEGNCLTYATRKQIATLGFLEELLSQGVDVNVKDEHGMSSLMYAATLYDDPKYMKLLLDAGGNPRAVDAEGNTLLMLVLDIKMPFTNNFVYEKFDILFRLCDIEVRNKSNENIFMLVRKRFCFCHMKVIESYIYFKLIEKMGDINFIRRGGESVLFSIVDKIKDVTFLHKVIDFIDLRLHTEEGFDLLLRIALYVEDASVLSKIVSVVSFRFRSKSHFILTLLAKNCPTPAVLHKVINVGNAQLMYADHNIFFTMARHCTDASVLLRLMCFSSPSCKSHSGNDLLMTIAGRANQIPRPVVLKVIEVTDQKVQNAAGENAIMIVAKNCEDEFVLNKIIEVADQKIKNSDGCNALLIMAKHCKIESVLERILTAADLRLKDNVGNNVMMTLVDHCESASILHSIVDLAVARMRGKIGEHTLIKVAKDCNNEDVLHKVLGAANLDIADDRGSNLLMLMAQNTCHLSVFNKIVRLAIERNISGECNKLFLILCDNCRFIEVIRDISVVCDTNTQDESGTTAPMLVAQRLCSLERILKETYVFALEKSKALSVVTASYNKDLRILKYLIPISNMNLQNQQGDNLLLLVTKECFKSNIFDNSVLNAHRRDQNADLTLKLKNFYSQKHFSLVKLLIGLCDVTVVNASGQNLLMLAAEHFNDAKCLTILKQLIGRGLDVYHVDRKGRNVLYYAVKNKSHRSVLVKFFLSLGVSPIEINNKGSNFAMKLAKKYLIIFHENIKYFEGSMFLIENKDKCTVLSIVLQNYVDSNLYEHGAEAKITNELITTIFAMAASATNNHQLNCARNMHPSDIFFKGIFTHCRYRSNYFSGVLEALILSPFKNLDVCATFNELHPGNKLLYFCELLPPNLKYNAVSAVMQYHLASLTRNADPTDLIVKMVNAGYAMSGENVVSPLSVFLHQFTEHRFGDRPEDEVLVNLVRIFIQNGVDVNQRVARFIGYQGNLEVPDALRLAAKAGFVECVKLLLEHWSMPPLGLLLFVEHVQNAANLYPILKQFGPLPYGFEDLHLISQILEDTDYQQDFLNLHNAAPRSLMDYSRAVVRFNINVPDKAPVIRQLDLPSKLQDYLLYM